MTIQDTSSSSKRNYLPYHWVSYLAATNVITADLACSTYDAFYRIQTNTPGHSCIHLASILNYPAQIGDTIAVGTIPRRIPTAG